MRQPRAEASTGRRPHEQESLVTDEKPRHVPFPEDDNGAPKPPDPRERRTL